MAQLTITEALAEIKTIDKRVDKKHELIRQHLARHEQLRDPFEREGGSVAVVAQELQSIRDLETRKVAIRLAIQDANRRIAVTVRERTMTIAEWLIWRREVAPKRQAFLGALMAGLANVRQEAQRKGMTVGIGAGVQVGPTPQPPNVLVNLNERDLGKEVEELEAILGEVDGQLSLKNATEMITV